MRRTGLYVDRLIQSHTLVTVTQRKWIGYDQELKRMRIFLLQIQLQMVASTFTLHCFAKIYKTSDQTIYWCYVISELMIVPENLVSMFHETGILRI